MWGWTWSILISIVNPRAMGSWQEARDRAGEAGQSSLCLLAGLFRLQRRKAEGEAGKPVQLCWRLSEGSGLDQGPGTGTGTRDHGDAPGAQETAPGLGDPLHAGVRETVKEKS